MTFQKNIGLACVVAAFLLLAFPAQAAEKDQPLIQSINSFRQASQLGGYRYSFTLTTAAARHAKDMFQRQYFAHTDPSGRRFTVWMKGPAQFSAAGENIARNQKTPSLAVNAWMKSTGHRDNMLSKRFTHVGTAMVQGNLFGRRTTVYVALFGRPL